MLYGELKDFKGSFANCPALKAAIEFILEKAPGLPDGKHEMSDGMFAQLKHYSPEPTEKRPWEIHNKMIDVQCVLEGEEVLNFRDKDGMEVREDKLAEKDIAFLNAPPKGSEIPLTLRPGYFSVLFPQDAHQPECLTTVKEGRKIIVKIPVSLWK